ncbi:hypothetical protein [Actinocorallia longicatena]|uniref:Ig-like domain-containing protein n=1 Tax=Actinocorallia longicatena TaxID=111803 RepID=A0ABP6QJ79_9ACTN
MHRIVKLAAIAAASTAAVAVTASPALAWTNGPYHATTSALVVKVSGSPVATCTGSVLSGTMTTAGTFTVTAASATGCGVTVTPTGFPWSGSFSGGNATISNFKMSALGCTYAGSLSGPATGAMPPATVTFTDRPVSGTGLFCFSNVTVSATYVFTQP